MDRYIQIKRYWEKRADEYGTSPQATTKDYYMRQIEINCLSNSIKKYSKNKENFYIADIGCGNGYSTAELASKFPNFTFVGYDYSKTMINHAKRLLKKKALNNLNFSLLDIITDDLDQKFNIIYTDRCLINLPSWDLQKLAINKIYDSLLDDGMYLMIENFIEGHDNFNALRKQFRLAEIKIREHNLFFSKDKLNKYLNKLFKAIEFQNISSLYYIVSRIVYSKICSEIKEELNYLDIHHKLGSELPFLGDYGPICLYQLRKKI